MKTTEPKSTTSTALHTSKDVSPFFQSQENPGAFFGSNQSDSPFFQSAVPASVPLQPKIQKSLTLIQSKTQAPSIQLSPLSKELDALWLAQPNREAIFERISRDDAFNNRDDADLQTSLSAIFPDANDLWLAQKVLSRQLGESGGTFKGKPIKLPVELFFFKGKSAEKALVIAGVHGTEQQGIEVAGMLKKDLATNQPHFNVILVPSLFPINAKKNIREEGPESKHTNRNFPELGTPLNKTKKNATGQPLDADKDIILMENQLLIQLIERFQPSRIITIHGTQYADQAGIFSDKITQKPDYDKLYKEAARAATAMLEDDFMGYSRQSKEERWFELFNLMYTFLIDEHEKKNKVRTQTDKDLAVKTAQTIAAQTNSLTTLRDRHKSKVLEEKLESKKIKKGTPQFKEAIESLKQNPAVAGNKLDNPNPTPEWAGSTPEGVSLGEYAPSLGISVFTVEPALNKASSDYPNKSADPGVSQADRLAELKSYADAIRTVLLGK